MWVFERHQIQNLIIVNNNRSFPFWRSEMKHCVRDLHWHLFAIVALSLAENKCLFQNLFVSLSFCVIALMPPVPWISPD